MPRARLGDDWPEFGDEQLLDVRMADLPLVIEGVLAQRIDRLRGELDARGLKFPLHFYLSDEWFTPDGATAIAIPFYLAHPRLAALEEKQMFEVEGGEHEWCMRILRHEAGHAIDNAYRLRRRRGRRKVFGPSTLPYPESYAPKPYSKTSPERAAAAAMPRGRSRCRRSGTCLEVSRPRRAACRTQV